MSGDLRDRYCAELSDRRVCGTRRSFVLAAPVKWHGSSSVVEPECVLQRVRQRVVSAVPPHWIGGSPATCFTRQGLRILRPFADSPRPPDLLERSPMKAQSPLRTLCKKLIANESGLILSAELVLVLTIAVIGMVTGLACVQQAVVYELNDVGLAFSSLNQTYWTPSYRGGWKNFGGGRKSFVAGSSFIDTYGGAGVQGSSMVPVATGSGCVGVMSEINTGNPCATAIPATNGPASPVLIPQPMPQFQNSGVPCEACPSGTELVPCPPIGVPRSSSPW